MIEAAGAVFDHNHLVDCLAHAFGKDACDRVSTAARRERHDQTNWTRRIIVCARSTRITMPPKFGVTQYLAHFIATTRWDDIPPLVAHQAKRSFMNFFAVALAGCRTNPVEIALRSLAEFPAASRRRWSVVANESMR